MDITCRSKNSNGFKITRLTRGGMGPDKHSFVVMSYKKIVAVVSPECYKKIDDNKSEPLVVFCTRCETDESSCNLYNGEVGALITDEYRFNTMMDLKKLNQHFFGIGETYKDEFDEFRSIYMYELLAFE